MCRVARLGWCGHLVGDALQVVGKSPQDLRRYVGVQDDLSVALDGAKRPCRVRTSSAGQVLLSEMITANRAGEVAEGLMHPSFFSGWGIRTLGADQARFNPMSYHNGSVWPHDNALIALGMARYGLKKHVDSVFCGLFEAATYMEFNRLPELLCGFRRWPGRGPTRYPAACSPQAWASATPFALLQASLGLELDAPGFAVLSRSPSLPSFLEHVVVRNLSLGDSIMDLEFSREKGKVSLQVKAVHGPCPQVFCP